MRRLAFLSLVATSAFAQPVELPIKAVTVFSDRARVTRRAEVQVPKGVRRLQLAVLPPRADPDSVSLEVSGAALQRVEVRPIEPTEGLAQDVDRALKELDDVNAQTQAVEQQLENRESERQLVLRLRPTAPSIDAKGQPRPLEVGGWKDATQFFEARLRATDEAIAGLEKKRRDLADRMEEVQRKVNALAAGAAKPLKVEAVLESSGGPATLSLTYVAFDARWFPAYDVRYRPGEPKVELDFAAVVSQQTGEDWPASTLVLSTAVPAALRGTPKLSVWKLGERDRFIPTPVAKPKAEAVATETIRFEKVVLGKPADGRETRLVELENKVAELKQEVFKSKNRLELRKEEAKKDTEKDGKLAAETGVNRPPPAPKEREVDDVRAVQSLPGSVSESIALQSARLDGFAQAPVQPPAYVAFATPRAWQLPSFAPDLPAAQAGGYDFTFTAAQPEALRSGATARRVPLHRVSFAAQPEVTLMPALSPSAYLMANVVNESGRPLLRGAANLYVGADLVGQARVETTAPGERARVPLGVDEAVKVERKVDLVAAQAGLFVKQEVSTYDVRIELLSSRREPVKARVVDQLPLSGDEHVEVKLVSSTPAAGLDKPEGKLEWQLMLTPGVKHTLTFRYEVTRPAGARLRQW